MKEKIKNLNKYPIIVFFFCFVFAFMVIDMAIPQKSFSDLENRYLQKRPQFTLSSFYSGEFVPKYQEYINDQFLLRNQWIDLKSRIEFYLGKTENNNIIYGKNGYMFDKIKTINQKQLDKNIESINKYIQKNSDENINMMIIPSSFQILTNKLPMGLELINQDYIIKQIYDRYSKNDNVKCVDVSSVLKENTDKYIYYKTDHHWTTLGAYLSYSELMKEIGEEHVKIEELKSNNIENFYGTYYSKSKLFNATSDTITYYDVNIDEMTIMDNSYDSIYDYDKFKTRDKYAAFLYGNNDLTVIKNNTDKKDEDKTKILVIKDSYGNSFIPFLTHTYDEVYVLDLRSNSKKVSEIMNNYDFDQILIMYSIVNLSDDVNVVRISY